MISNPNFPFLLAMPEGESEAILGLSEFEEALHFFNEKKYD